ncbi:metallophosphoesterase [Pseudomonas qingdaonensis]|nr:metallophosphoesterase [Pseudomonas qingdaonensis]
MHGRPDNLHPSTELHHTSTSAHLRSFDLNNAGRDFIVGDIHGHFEQLEALLLRHRFNPSLDRVFCTGDLIDRGPFSEQAVDWLKHPWFHAVRGNHEQMVLDHAAGTGDAARHARNGGAWFYQLDAKRQQIVIDALAKLPMAIEVAVGNQRKIGVIHAELPGWEDQLDWNSAVALLCSSTPHAPCGIPASHVFKDQDNSTGPDPDQRSRASVCRALDRTGDNGTGQCRLCRYRLLVPRWGFERRATTHKRLKLPIMLQPRDDKRLATGSRLQAALLVNPVDDFTIGRVTAYRFAQQLTNSRVIILGKSRQQYTKALLKLVPRQMVLLSTHDHRVAGRDHLIAYKQFFVQLFPRAQSGELDSDISARITIGFDAQA